MLYIILLVALLLLLGGTLRGKKVALRPIQGFSDLQTSLSETLESGRAVHVSLGGSAVRDNSTLSALVSAEVLYQTLLRAAPGDKKPLVTLSDAVTLGLAQDRIRRAYQARYMPESYTGKLARWYPQGPRSLVFAAGAGAALRDSDAALNVLVGKFGPEMVLLAESAVRYNRTIIAHSDDIAGQAVAYAVSDSPIYGEELYAGTAYLDPRPVTQGAVLAQDGLRYLVIGTIIVIAAMAFLGAG